MHPQHAKESEGEAARGSTAWMWAELPGVPIEGEEAASGSQQGPQKVDAYRGMPISCSAVLPLNWPLDLV